MRQIFVGVVAVAVAVGTFELAGALKRARGIRVALWPVLIGGQAMVWLSWPFERDGLLAAFVLTVLACMVWRFAGGIDGYLRDCQRVGLHGRVRAAARVVRGDAGGARGRRGRVLCFMILVVCSDTGGYIAGVLLRQAPDGAVDQPEEVLGGLRRVDGRGHRRRRARLT